MSFAPKRNASGKGGRPAPQRHSSGSGGRSSPYNRPPPAPPAPDGKWQHDLFGKSSDLYSPSLNAAAVRAQLGLGSDAPSASLRPFGNATPAAQPIISVAPTGPRAAAVENPALGIKGQGAAAVQRQAENAARKERAELIRQRKILEEKRKAVLHIVEQEAKGFVVQVEGLVSGTSAEDVQTAFSAYGEIAYCFVVDPAAADLVARLTFSRHSDATDACAKLDGAIADGRPLRVKQVDRTAMPPPLPRLPPPVKTIASIAGAPTEPRAQRRAAAPAVAIPAATPSRMYADQIESAQQVALSGATNGGAESMDVEMAPAVPTGPRGRGARVGPGAVQQAPANPLMARLGVTPAGTPSGPAAMRGQQQQQQRGAQPNQLAARLGVATGQPQQQAQGHGQVQQGRGPRGGRGGAAQGATAGSLLARLT